MAVFPGLKTQAAIKALSYYLDQAGIVRTEDRLLALHRHYSITWLDMLKKAGVTGFDIFDIQDARDHMLEQLRILLAAGVEE